MLLNKISAYKKVGSSLNGIPGYVNQPVDGVRWHATLQGHPAPISDLTFIPDRWLVTATGTEIYFWDATTNVLLGKIQEHSSPITALAVLDQKLLISVSNNGEMMMYDVTKAMCIRKISFGIPLYSLAILPDKRIAMGLSNGLVNIFDLTTERYNSTILHTDMVSSLTINNRGKLVSGSWDKTIKIWDPNANTCLPTLEGHTGPVTSLTILPNNGRLVSGDSNGKVMIWSMNTLERRATLQEHSEGITDLAVLPTGMFASASRDKTITIWDTDTSQYLATLREYNDLMPPSSVVPPPFKGITALSSVNTNTGWYLASVSDDLAIKLWGDLSTVRIRPRENAGLDARAVRILNHPLSEQVSLLPPLPPPPAQVNHHPKPVPIRDMPQRPELLPPPPVHFSHQVKPVPIIREVVGIMPASAIEPSSRRPRQPPTSSHLPHTPPPQALISPSSSSSTLVSSSDKSNTVLIPPNEIRKGERIGEPGSYGAVYKARWKNKDVAVKELHITGRLPEKLTAEFIKEAALLTALNDNPYIVRLFGISVTAPYCLVMELMEGSLDSLIYSRNELPWPVRIQLAIDIASGIQALHSAKIFHRDLKSLNILVYTDKGQRHAKVGDLGVAKSVKSHTTAHTERKVQGTLRWTAPEILQRSPFTYAADIYSFGAILWELAARRLPFEEANNDALLTKWITDGSFDYNTVDGKNTLETEGCPPFFLKTMKSCWHKSDRERFSLQEALNMLKQREAPQPSLQTRGYLPPLLSS